MANPSISPAQSVYCLLGVRTIPLLGQAALCLVTAPKRQDIFANE